jgi:hypothetical protein
MLCIVRNAIKTKRKCNPGPGHVEPYRPMEELWFFLHVKWKDFGRL